MAESFSSVHLGDFKAQDQCSVNTGHSVYLEQMTPSALGIFPVKGPVIANVENKLLK